jgi:hypothetical protein
MLFKLGICIYQYNLRICHSHFPLHAVGHLQELPQPQLQPSVVFAAEQPQPQETLTHSSHIPPCLHEQLPGSFLHGHFGGQTQDSFTELSQPQLQPSVVFGAEQPQPQEALTHSSHIPPCLHEQLPGSLLHGHFGGQTQDFFSTEHPLPQEHIFIYYL